MSEYCLIVNGLEIQATFAEESISNIFVPLLRKLKSMQQDRDKRLIVFLAAPPASGKSTLGAFLEMLSLQYEGMEPIQSVGIDGFHYHQEYILTQHVYRNGTAIPMKDVKGCPESYDVEKLAYAVQTIREKDIRWPFYSRQLHDVVENAIDVNRKIILVEGNWLLLNETRWSALRDLCDYSIMLRAEESQLKDRLIERKIRGGLSRQEAQQYYMYSDRLNILRCLNNSVRADMTLQLRDDGYIVLN